MPKKRDTIPNPAAPYDRAFQPIARELSFFLRDWNDLQVVFQVLFQNISGIEEEMMVTAIWHAVTNDRMQRAMLLRATAVACSEGFAGWAFAPKDEKFREHLYKEVKWLVERADSLGQQRDGVAHSPVEPTYSETFSLTYIASTRSGHPRGFDLKDKSLLKEIRLYRNRANALYS